MQKKKPSSNQGLGVEGKQNLCLISPRFECVIVDIFTILMLRYHIASGNIYFNLFRLAKAMVETLYKFGL